MTYTQDEAIDLIRNMPRRVKRLRWAVQIARDLHRTDAGAHAYVAQQAADAGVAEDAWLDAFLDGTLDDTVEPGKDELPMPVPPVVEDQTETHARLARIENAIAGLSGSFSTLLAAVRGEVPAELAVQKRLAADGDVLVLRRAGSTFVAVWTKHDRVTVLDGGATGVGSSVPAALHASITVLDLLDRS